MQAPVVIEFTLSSVLHVPVSIFDVKPDADPGATLPCKWAQEQQTHHSNEGLENGSLKRLLLQPCQELPPPAAPMSTVNKRANAKSRQAKTGRWLPNPEQRQSVQW